MDQNKKKRPALFLDRDGTVNYDPGYISSPKKIQLLYGAREALIRFRAAGYLIIVISNQSGIGRGYFSDRELTLIHQRMDEKLGPAKPDAYYYCPHIPDDRCSCRKPETGNLERAYQEWPIDKNRSVMIGDSLSDLEAGRNFGIASFLVLTGYGHKSLQRSREKYPQQVQAFDNLARFADYFLGK